MAGKAEEKTRLRAMRVRDGVLRYEDGAEVALWGVNYQTSMSWEYNASLRRCGIPLEIARMKQVIDQDFEHLKRMNVGVIRVHLLPGDFTDGEGNLVDTVFLDALDYLVHRC